MSQFDVRLEIGEGYVLLFLVGDFTDDDCELFRKAFSECVKEPCSVAIGFAELESLSRQAVFTLHLLTTLVLVEKDRRIAFFASSPEIKEKLDKPQFVWFSTKEEVIRYLLRAA